MSHEIPASTLQQSALTLVGEALRDLEGNASPLSAVVRKSSRIARIRQDFENLFLLEFEMQSHRSLAGIPALRDETRPHFTKTKWNELGARAFGARDAERKLTMDNPAMKIKAGETLDYSIEELEDKLKSARELRSTLENDSDVESERINGAATRERADLCAGLRIYEQEVTAILNRIKQRVHAYLSQCEADLVRGAAYSDTFIRLCANVERTFAGEAPAVLAELKAAQKLCGGEDAAANAQAMLSCRRALKGLADFLYPPSDAVIVGADGVKRSMTDDKYINRLWQYLHERPKGETHHASIVANIEDIGRRLESVNDLASKGLHATASSAEAQSCVVQAWLIAADLAIIHEETGGRAG